MYRRSTLKQPEIQATAKPAAAASRGFSIAGTLRRHARTIVLMSLGLGLLVPLASKLVDPRYLSVTQVVIDPTELQIVDKSLRQQAQITDALIAQVESQVRVLLSTNVLKRVIEREGLANDPEFAGEGKSGISAAVARLAYSLGLSSTSPSAQEDPALEALRTLTKRVGARRAERTFVVDVSVWTKDPLKSARLADAVVTSFMDERTEASSEAARRASESLNVRLDPLKKRVLDAESRVEAFKRDNGIISTGGQLVDEQQLSAISSQLVLARARTAEAEAQYTQISAIKTRGGDAGSIPEAVRSNTLGSLRSQYSAAVRREAELGASLLPGHPLMMQARLKTEKAKKEVDAEVARIATAAQSELQRARGGEKSLSDSLETARRELNSTNQSQIRLRELEREANTDRQIYEQMKKRTQEILEQEKIDSGYVRVISRAELPERPVWPLSKPLLLLAGLLAGAALGAGLGFASDLGLAGRRDGRMAMAG